MTSLEKYNLGVSKSVKTNLLANLFQSDDLEGYVELVISLDESGLNIKGLSTYLEFIYRLDGLLSDFSFFQYSHSPRTQIEIDEIRIGSWEIVIRELFGSARAEKLVLIGLCLRYLPNIINSFMDIGLKLVEYRDKNEDYLEKKERREFRKSIRDSIANDDELNSVDKKTKENVINLLDELYLKNKNHIPGSTRFAAKSVKSIKLNKGKKNK